MKRSGMWIVAGLAAATFATPVRAQQLFFDGYCIMGSFQVCASVRVFSEGNTLRMRVWNLEGTLGGAHTMTAIGLYHNGSPWAGRVLSYSVTYDGENITSRWKPKWASDIETLAGIDLELGEGTSGNRGIVGCTVPGGLDKWPTCNSFDDQPYVEFTFNLSSNFSLANTELRWHSQQVGPLGELSLKCDTGGAGDYPTCAPPPTQVVPEPLSVLLLGSGLAGVGAAARRRRRRQQPEAEPAD
jgi:hypothetical protein